VLSNRTVFLLGAGANVPYGFSTGAVLVDKLRGKDPRTLMGNSGEQITRAESNAFKQALDGNMLPSIDSMLEHRQDLWKVGKRVMATLLYQEEAGASPRSSDTDWMALIFDRMCANARTVEEFGQNPVWFVTFNYDRYLEYRFIQALVQRYNVPAQRVWAAVGQMFLHLYGSLGPLPEMAPIQAGAQPIPLGAPDTEDTYTLGLALSSVENSIRIVHDHETPPAAFADAGRAFLSAQIILFLGFGFGSKNVERLRLDTIAPPIYVNYTAYGMTEAEIAEQVSIAFPLQSIGVPPSHTRQWSIRQFLREGINQYLQMGRPR
jgi:hypothetical protein